LPKKEGKFPIVVLVSGSGPQDRNEELLGHKPFLVLADHLTRQGVGVLRYDDRGVGKSTGKFSGGTSEDFASDVLAAVAYLRGRPEVEKGKIGIVGHSEGGLIAPMCAVRSKDVNFIVLLAGPGVDGEAILLTQFELINRANGYTEEKNMQEKSWNAEQFQLIKMEQDTAMLRKKMTALLQKQYAELPEEDLEKIPDLQKHIQSAVETITSDWFRFFVRYDPKTSLEKVKCPVLALNGEKDLQVEPKENLAGIKTALEKGKNKNFVVKELPGLNHLFQTCETGAPAEYSAIEETFSPVALKEISDWVLVVVQ
jgi:pimeloyl-ACP methyl ester carboxylesterase